VHATTQRSTAPLPHDIPAGADPNDIARLLVRCSDQPGIVAAVSRFLYERGANIVASAQYTTDPSGGEFLLRAVIQLPSLMADRDDLERAFQEEIAEAFEMTWHLTPAVERKRVALMVSKYDHCALDLLWRGQREEIPMNIGLVISNHPDLAEPVRSFGVPYVHIPINKENKADAEEHQLELLRGNFDLVVLARYMQILSGHFLDAVGCPVINIHHSFLPAFAGADPYARAKERGVKLIGATAHYATVDLDEGPIIEQDIVRASHNDNATDLERRGADVERTVLARAVDWHCNDRVARLPKSTVVL
jgi:formyltetrahydrofolate deformylase